MTTADLVFINGKVLTVDEKFSVSEAVSVKGGFIQDVGKSEDIKKYIGANTKMIDLGGKVLMPAAHDAHAHGVVFGLTGLQADCSYPKISSVEDLQKELAVWAAKTPKGKWIRGNGINADNFIKDGRLTRQMLDEATPDNPVVILNWSGHSNYANSMALKLAGIDKNTPDPEGGVIVRDDSGEPTGQFNEAVAMNMLTAAVPLWSAEEIEAGIMNWQNIMLSNGYASFTESTLGPCGDSRDSGSSGQLAIATYKRLLKEGKLKIRTSIGYYTGKDGVQSYEGLKHDIENMPEEFKDLGDPAWLKMNMIKIFCDGVHVAYTGWMLDDYAGRPGFRGRSALPGKTDEDQAAELRKMIKYAHDKGFQIGVHTIGNRAVKETVDAMAEAITDNPRPDSRHYVIHAESLGTNEMMEKAAHYGIGESAQPGLADYMYEVSFDVVGKMAERLFGLKEFLNLGLHVAGGADALNGEYCHWRRSVQSAMSRKSAITQKVYCPELAITLEDGIRMYTMGGAYQEHDENSRGSIEVGKAADFQVLDKDITSVPTEQIGDIKVLLTVVAGNIEYQAEGADQA